MGKHDHECGVCGKVTLNDQGMDKRCCGVGMFIRSAPTVKNFKSFWHPHLGHEPVFVDSSKTLDRELEKRGSFIQEAPKGERAVRLPQSREEALNA